ncbi:MAG: response regulator [Lachnospiraceae bacterium]|nr:response regulator [Lachnospiraceae bacterium]
MRILAIDDNAVNLATLEQELRDDYEIIPMLSGKRAIKYLYNERVDLILLDVQMPIMDGVQTLKEIRKLDVGVTVPVIFLTASKDRVTVLEGSKLGIMDYVTKPFDTVDLKNRIEMVFKRMGIVPIEEGELLTVARKVLQDIVLGKGNSAITQIDEMLRYQIDDDLSKRVHKARVQLEAEDMTGAGKIMLRVIQKLEKHLQPDEVKPEYSISNRMLAVKLLYLLEDLEQFRNQEVTIKCEELKKYIMPESIKNDFQEVVKYLDKYEEEDAIKLLKKMVVALTSA